MAIYKITYIVVGKEHDVYIVSDTLAEAERLFLKHNELQVIDRVQTVSRNVINQWAQ